MTKPASLTSPLSFHYWNGNTSEEAVAVYYCSNLPVGRFETHSLHTVNIIFPQTGGDAWRLQLLWHIHNLWNENIFMRSHLRTNAHTLAHQPTCPLAQSWSWSVTQSPHSGKSDLGVRELRKTEGYGWRGKERRGWKKTNAEEEKEAECERVRWQVRGERQRGCERRLRVEGGECWQRIRYRETARRRKWEGDAVGEQTRGGSFRSVLRFLCSQNGEVMWWIGWS